MPEKNRIPVIEATNPPEWSVDLSEWSVLNSKQWTESIKTDDYEMMTELLAMITDSLPNGDAVTVENIEKMKLVKLAEVILMVQEELGAIFLKTREARRNNISIRGA